MQNAREMRVVRWWESIVRLEATLGTKRFTSGHDVWQKEDLRALKDCEDCVRERESRVLRALLIVSIEQSNAQNAHVPQQPSKKMPPPQEAKS